MIFNYKQTKLLVKDRARDARHALDTCCVVGKAVEASLKLAYRPQVGIAPIPLQCQTAADLATMEIADVVLEGTHLARRVHVKVPVADATLAIKVAKEVVTSLQRQPYNLEVLTVDHTGPSSCAVPHDLIMSTRLWGASCLVQGRHSVEVRCREVVSRTAFDWEGTLSSESTPLWSAEVQGNARDWQSRIMLLVAMPRPCHSGPYALHASIMKVGERQFSRLWGWTGYRKRVQTNAIDARRAADVADQLQPSGAAKAKAKPRAAPTPPLQPPLGPSAKWDVLNSRLNKHKGHWVRIVDFLDKVKASRRHSMRFLDGKHKLCWVLGTRSRKPMVKQDYLKMKGTHGGGQGNGMPYGKTSFLREVFLKYYVATWNP
jgi:hypothetical protein